MEKKNLGAYPKDVSYCVANSLVVSFQLLSSFSILGKQGYYSHSFWERAPDTWLGAAGLASFCLSDLAIYFHLVPKMTII